MIVAVMVLAVAVTVLAQVPVKNPPVATVKDAPDGKSKVVEVVRTTTQTVNVETAKQQIAAIDRQIAVFQERIAELQAEKAAIKTAVESIPK